jgi:hypothetical protein
MIVLDNGSGDYTILVGSHLSDERTILHDVTRLSTTETGTHSTTSLSRRIVVVVVTTVVIVLLLWRRWWRRHTTGRRCSTAWRCRMSGHFLGVNKFPLATRGGAPLADWEEVSHSEGFIDGSGASTVYSQCKVVSDVGLEAVVSTIIQSTNEVVGLGWLVVRDDTVGSETSHKGLESNAEVHSRFRLFLAHVGVATAGILGINDGDSGTAPSVHVFNGIEKGHRIHGCGYVCFPVWKLLALLEAFRGDGTNNTTVDSGSLFSNESGAITVDPHVILELLQGGYVRVEDFIISDGLFGDRVLAISPHSGVDGPLDDDVILDIFLPDRKVGIRTKGENRDKTGACWSHSRNEPSRTCSSTLSWSKPNTIVAGWIGTNLLHSYERVKGLDTKKRKETNLNIALELNWLLSK